MSNRNVLNESLYNALEALFGDVQVADQGVRRSVVYQPDWQHGGRLKAVATEGGEQYFIQCPQCGGDRCYVSHEYGVRDVQTGSDNRHLVHCFHENCFADPAVRQAFWLWLQSRYARLRAGCPGGPAAEPCQELPHAEPPGQPDPGPSTAGDVRSRGLPPRRTRLRPG